MVWYIIAGIAFAAALGLLISTSIRDRRYLRLKTSEAMSPELRAEIEQEREESLARRERFEQALQEAQSRTKEGHDGPH